MTIIKVQKREKYSIIENSVIEDKRLSSKYLGVFVRLISKKNDWEISVSGLATLYPTEGIDFYRSALKELCKYGYLIRIPQPKIKGQYQKVEMHLFEECQLDKPLSDENVSKLFGKKGLSTEEIQKIYPKRIFQYGSAETVQPRQTNTDYSVTNNVVNVCLGSDEINFLNSRGSYEIVHVTEIEQHLKEYPEELVTETIEYLKTYKNKISNIYSLSEAIVKKKVEASDQKSTSAHFKASETAKQLEERVRYQIPDLSPSETKQWPLQFQKIHEEKQISYEHLQQLIENAHEDEFWKSVILTPRSLSKNMLKLKALQNQNKTPKKKNHHTDKEPFDMPNVEIWNIGDNCE